MRPTTLSYFLLCLCGAAIADEVPVKFTVTPVVTRDDQKATIRFEVSTRTDVEVAIVDAQGKVVRHLAAGVLGGEKPPPAPLMSGLSQTIEWDGRDDYGETVAGAQVCSVRVRAGMGVKLDCIVGGDPYGYYSTEMDSGNHALWKMSGLDARPDGTVYVFGMTTGAGPPALRQYDADGNYLRTVFPPPAGKPAEQMMGWGINPHPGGTWSPRFNVATSAIITRTLLSIRKGNIADLLPSVEHDELVLRQGFSTLTIRADGTLPESQPVPLVISPALEEGHVEGHDKYTMKGPLFYCPSPDGKYFYLSGIGKCVTKYGSLKSAVTTGFWRGAQVWKVDAATRSAKVFFSLPEEQVAPSTEKFSYTAFHGIAVDGQHNVFLCDRHNKRVVVLDKDGKVLRELPVEYPDAIAVSPKSNAAYVTTRVGNDHKHGEVGLVRFADWLQDTQPSESLKIGPVRCEYYTGHKSLVAAVSSGDGVNVWVAYKTLPVQVYRDDGQGLQLLKDFHEACDQRCLDLHNIAVDSATDTVYVADSFGALFRVGDGEKPEFVRCGIDDETPVEATSIAIDSRRRHLYARHPARGPGWAGPVERYHMDGEFLVPANVGDTGDNDLTGSILNSSWLIGWGYSDRGIAAVPDGSLATLNDTMSKGNTGYGGRLRLFKRDLDEAPWQPMEMNLRGDLGGLRFDPQGNLYVGVNTGSRDDVPDAFANDDSYARVVGMIHKYAPIGSLASGDLFPTALAGPAQVYDMHYGVFPFRYTRTSRFGVDDYGRIYYPSTLAQQVGVIDNEGNEIVRFGTYGNRDSMGGLKGDLVPTKDIPLGWPNSVDATDDHIYIGDVVNCRLLRLAKTSAVEAFAP